MTLYSLRCPANRNLQRFVAAIVLLARMPACGFGNRGLCPQITAIGLASNQVHPGEAVMASYEFVNVGTAPAGGECTVFVHVRPALPGDPDVKPAAGDDFHPLTPTFLWSARRGRPPTGPGDQDPQGLPARTLSHTDRHLRFRQRAAVRIGQPRPGGLGTTLPGGGV